MKCIKQRAPRFASLDLIYLRPLALSLTTVLVLQEPSPRPHFTIRTRANPLQNASKRSGSSRARARGALIRPHPLRMLATRGAAYRSLGHSGHGAVATCAPTYRRGMLDPMTMGPKETPSIMMTDTKITRLLPFPTELAQCQHEPPRPRSPVRVDLHVVPAVGRLLQLLDGGSVLQGAQRHLPPRAADPQLGLRGPERRYDRLLHAEPAGRLPAAVQGDRLQAGMSQL